MTSSPTPLAIDNTQPLYVAVDFDGTCVTHEYPRVGRDIGAVPVLRALVRRGCKLVLFTMRSGTYLDDAVVWFAQHNIPLHGVNHNPDQASWTSSPKAYAHLYLDDAALGCPLVRPKDGRPFVNWCSVAKKLHTAGILTTQDILDIDFAAIRATWPAA